MVTAVPATGNTFQRPVRLTICPETVDDSSRPNTIGSMYTPDMVGVTPRTTCKNVGRYVIAPNIAKPMTKLMTAESAKVRTRKSLSGRTGSAALRSTATKSTARTTASTARPMICGELQAQVVPPSEATRTREVATEAMRRVPR